MAGEQQSQQQSDESTPTMPLPRSFESLLGGNRPPKMEWPELVGLTAEEAEAKVKEEMPGVSIQVVQPDCFVTMDFNLQRLRFYINNSGLIERTPKLG